MMGALCLNYVLIPVRICRPHNLFHCMLETFHNCWSLKFEMWRKLNGLDNLYLWFAKLFWCQSICLLVVFEWELYLPLEMLNYFIWHISLFFLFVSHVSLSLFFLTKMRYFREAAIEDYFKPIDKEAEIVMKMQLAGEEKLDNETNSKQHNSDQISSTTP